MFRLPGKWLTPAWLVTDINFSAFHLEPRCIKLTYPGALFFFMTGSQIWNRLLLFCLTRMFLLKCSLGQGQGKVPCNHKASFIAQKANVWVVADAKYLYPSYTLMNWICGLTLGLAVKCTRVRTSFIS